MTIVHLISSLKIGGAEAALVNFLTTTAGNNDQQHIVLYFHDGPNKQKIEQLGIKTYHLSGIFCRFDFWAFWKTWRIIKKVSPQIIHSSLWMANIFGRLIGKLINVPVICDLHGSAGEEGIFRNTLDALTATWSSALVAVSPSVQQAYKSFVINRIPHSYQSAVTSNLSVIVNGIDQQKCLSLAAKNPLTRQDFGITAADFVIGSVGRLEPIKAYDILIKAFALLVQQLPSDFQVKLCLVGNGSQYQELQTLVQTLHLSDRIIFIGARSDAIKFYSLFDCFTLSSHSEGLSIALLEALSFGLPIVSTKQGTQHDVLADKVNGLLVPPNSPQAFCDALMLLINKPELRDSMKKNNLELVTEYSLITTAQRYQTLYKSLSKR